MAYLQKVKTKLHLETPLKSVHLLDGAYEAVVKGPSMEFDELRAYSVGDRRKDIDWKSSARANGLLVKQYIAQKRMPVEIIVDTGVNMSGLSPSSETKLEVALTMAGVLSFLALNHNDTVGFVVGNAVESQRFKQSSTSKTVESNLQTIAGSKLQNYSDIAAQLDSAVLAAKTRRVFLVITGLVDPDPELSDIIRKAKAKHDILWVTVADINPFAVAGGATVDVETKTRLPEFLKRNKKLQAKFEVAEKAREEEEANFFRRENVPHITINDTMNVIESAIDLLLIRKHGNR